MFAALNMRRLGRRSWQNTPLKQWRIVSAYFFSESWTADMHGRIGTDAFPVAK